MSKGPVNTKYELYLMKKRGEKIDPNVMVDNTPDIQLYGVTKEKKRAFRRPKSKFNIVVDVPIDTKEQNKIADELLAWVIKEKPTEIRQFFWDRGMSFYQFKKCSDKYNPYLQSALILAGEIISGKIMDSWLKKEFDGNAAHKILWTIDRGYKEERSEEKKLDKIVDEDKEIRFIYDTKEEK